MKRSEISSDIEDLLYHSNIIQELFYTDDLTNLLRDICNKLESRGVVFEEEKGQDESK